MAKLGQQHVPRHSLIEPYRRGITAVPRIGWAAGPRDGMAVYASERSRPLVWVAACWRSWGTSRPRKHVICHDYCGIVLWVPHRGSGSHSTVGFQLRRWSSQPPVHQILTGKQLPSAFAPASHPEVPGGARVIEEHSSNIMWWERAETRWCEVYRWRFGSPFGTLGV